MQSLFVYQIHNTYNSLTLLISSFSTIRIHLLSLSTIKIFLFSILIDEFQIVIVSVLYNSKDHWIPTNHDQWILNKKSAIFFLCLTIKNIEKLLKYKNFMFTQIEWTNFANHTLLYVFYRDLHFYCSQLEMFIIRGVHKERFQCMYIVNSNSTIALHFKSEKR